MITKLSAQKWLNSGHKICHILGVERMEICFLSFHITRDKYIWQFLKLIPLILKAGLSM